MHLLKKIFFLSVFFATSSILLKAQLATPGVIYAATSDGKIYELNEDFSQKRLVVELPLQLVSMTINSAGQVYVASDNDNLYMVNLVSASLTQVVLSGVSSDQSISRIVFDKEGRLNMLFDVLAPPGWRSLLYEYDPASKALTYMGRFTTITVDFDNIGLSSLAIEPYTGQLFSHIRISNTQGTVGELTIGSELQYDVKARLYDFHNLFFTSRGGLYVFNEQEVVAVNWRSGEFSTVYFGQFPYNSVAMRPPPTDEQGPVAVFPTRYHADELLAERAIVRKVFMINRGETDYTYTLENSNPDEISVQRINDGFLLAGGSGLNLNVRINKVDVGVFSDTLRLTTGELTTCLAFSGETFESSTREQRKIYFLSSNFKLFEASPEDWSLKELSTLRKPIRKITVNSEGRLFGVYESQLFHIDPASGLMSIATRLPSDPEALVFSPDNKLITATTTYYSTFSSGAGFDLFDPAFYSLDTQVWEDVKGDFLELEDLAFSPMRQLFLLDREGEMVGSLSGEFSLNWSGSFERLNFGQGFRSFFFISPHKLAIIVDDYKYDSENKSAIMTYDMNTQEYEIAKDLGELQIISAAAFTAYSSVAGNLGTKIKAIAFPNPFSETINVSFFLQKPTEVQMQVFDVGGKIVFSTNSSFCAAGEGQMVWNGRNDSGQKVNNGIYILKIKTSESEVNSFRILLIE